MTIRGQRCYRCAMPRTHASLPRLYVEPDLSAGAQLTLGKEQSLYLAAVLRKSVGAMKWCCSMVAMVPGCAV